MLRRVPLILTVRFLRRAVQMGSVDNVVSVPTIGSAVRGNAARVPGARRNVLMAAAEKTVTTARPVHSVIPENAVAVANAKRNALTVVVDKAVTGARTVHSVIPENAVIVATAQRNAPTVVVEKTVTRARTIRSVILESAVTRIIPVRAFVPIASLGQPLEALSLAVWFSVPL